MSNLNLLYIFWEVAKTKNITKASQKLFVSQPAVSASIKELEKIYGKPLFIRKNKGMELNYFGEKLFNQINTSMNNLSDLDVKLSTFTKQQTGYIRIATNTSNLNKLISDEISKFTKLYPDIELTVSRLTEDEIIEKSANGDYDLVFIDGEYDHSQFEEINKLTIEYKVIGNKYYYDKYKNNPLSLDNFNSENLILSNKTYTSRKNIDDYFSKHDIALNPKFELDGYSYVADFLVDGLGISILNPFYYSNLIEKNILYIIPTKFSIDKRDIYLLKPIKTNSDIYASKFISKLQSIDLNNA